MQNAKCRLGRELAAALFAADAIQAPRAEPEWSRFELFSDKKNNKKKGDECLK